MKKKVKNEYFQQTVSNRLTLIRNLPAGNYDFSFQIGLDKDWLKAVNLLNRLMLEGKLMMNWRRIR